MTDILWPIAFVLTAAAIMWGVRDCVIRTLEHSKAEQHHNAALKADFSTQLAQHQATYLKAGQELLRQMREEVDSLHKEVGACAAWVKTRTGTKDPGKLEPWEQAAIEDRQKRRAAAQGRAT